MIPIIGKVTSKSILSPLQNVWLVALEVKVTAVAPIVVTVIELVLVSQARGSMPPPSRGKL